MTKLIPLASDQISACAQLLVCTYACPPWSEAYDPGTVVRYLSKFLKDPAYIALVWTEDNMPKGLALGMRIPGVDSDYFRLEEFCTWPQQQGIGRHFMDALKAHIYHLGMDSMILGTVRDFPACTFYQKNHFQLLADSASLYCPLTEEGNEL